MADFKSFKIALKHTQKIIFVRENAFTVKELTRQDGLEIRDEFYNSLSEKELKNLLHFSVEREQYEAAAKIRDVIQSRQLV